MSLVTDAFKRATDEFREDLNDLFNTAALSNKDVNEQSVAMFLLSVKLKMYLHFGDSFVAKFRKEAEKYIKAYYIESYDDEIDKYNTVNEQVIAILANIDNFYFGQSISSPVVAQKLLDYIQQTYFVEGVSSWNQIDFQAMYDAIPELIGIEAWRLSRIVSTSVSRVKNLALLTAMNNAGVEQFQIVSANDLLTCKYCKELDGKTFSVSAAYNELGNIAQNPSAVGNSYPFITSLYPKPADISGKTSEQIAAQGFKLIPAHPHCRCVIVAVI